MPRPVDKKSGTNYAHHEYNGVYGAGAGPLRARPKPQETYGVCKGPCHSKQYKGRKKERLFDGLCDWCRWYINDNEVGEG